MDLRLQICCVYLVVVVDYLYLNGLLVFFLSYRSLGVIVVSVVYGTSVPAVLVMKVLICSRYSGMC